MFPARSQELRAKNVGHVVLNSSLDRPWSNYFCCMLAGNRDFVRKHPVATKRALRAVLKATAVCATDRGGDDQEHAAEDLAQDTDWRFFDELKQERKG